MQAANFAAQASARLSLKQTPKLRKCEESRPRVINATAKAKTSEIRDFRLQVFYAHTGKKSGPLMSLCPDASG